jgi:VCBS repeat-containing protein/predicted outer membrane repeat protein
VFLSRFIKPYSIIRTSFLLSLTLTTFLYTFTIARSAPALAADVCFIETTGDNVTDYSSADETALQDAVNAASFGAMIKVAGTCAGTHTQGGRVITVYIAQTLTIRGGYNVNNWLAEPNPTINPTLFNAMQEGRVVFVATGNHNVTLRGLRLTGGSGSNGGGIENRAILFLVESLVFGNTATSTGGGILNQGGTVSLTDSTISGNSTNVSGGGVYNTSGTLTLTGSSLNNNSADSGSGGGIHSNGTSSVTLTNSTLDGNTAGSQGGAIYSTNAVNVINSTVSNNIANAEGGGVHNHSTGLLTLTNSTFHHNTSGSQGGGIFTSGLLNITNSTLSGNQANGATQGGGAIAMNGTSTFIQYSTFAGNSSPFVTGQDGIWLNAGSLTISSSILGSNGTENCRVTSGTLTSQGYNLSSDSSCPFSQTGDQNNTNPNLGPLANHGGPTLTHFLLPFSPAIDTIPSNTNNCGTTLVNDQRGLIRPVDVTCDKGSVELDTNYVPTAAPETYNLNEDSSLNVSSPGVLSNDMDGDWDSLTTQLDTTTTDGILTLNGNGSFNYIPVANFCGMDSFTYHAKDGQANSNVTTVTLNVSCINDTPIVGNDVYETLEDTVLNVPVQGVLENDQDDDDDPLTAELNTLPVHGLLNLNENGSFTYTPDNNYCGTDSFTYHANDGAVNSNLATVSLTIPCVNDQPVAVSDAYTTLEDTALDVPVPGILVNDWDVESTSLTAILNLSTTNGTLTLNEDGSFSYTPAENFCGTDSFTYTASDGLTASNIATVEITITCINDIPEVDAGNNQIVNEGAILTFSGEFFDPETNSNLQIAWDFGDGSGATGTLTPSHTYPDEEIFTVTLIITDDEGATMSDTLVVTVLNTPPILGNLPNKTLVLGSPVSFAVAYHDVGILDTHTATINWRDGTVEPATVNTSSEIISGSHMYTEPGIYSVIIIVTDNGGAETIVTFIVTVSQIGKRDFLIYLPILTR